MSDLDGEKRIRSTLWFDQPDAHATADRLLESGAASYEEAVRLHYFIDNGYLTLRLRDAEEIAEAFERGVDHLWKTRPFDLLLAGRGSDHVLRHSECPDEWRAGGYRLTDIHSHLGAARDLYLSPEIFRYVELLFGEKALAFQSLYFPDGSEQGLHRDPMYVVTRPASHLLAAWIALEDIGPDCGPLTLVPGSHRLPWYEFEPGKVSVSGHTGTHENYVEYTAFAERCFAEHGLSPRNFVCKRGEVLLWHGALFHGGSAIARPGSTRRSLVVHYSTLAHYASRTVSFRERDEDGNSRLGSAETKHVHERDGCHGLANPMAPSIEPYRAD